MPYPPFDLKEGIRSNNHNLQWIFWIIISQVLKFLVLMANKCPIRCYAEPQIDVNGKKDWST